MPVGTNVYEEEWDVLLVLDACRVDTLHEVASEYDFIGEVETRWSVGSQSDEWMANTFTREYQSKIEQTRYLSGNGHASQLFERGILPPKNNTTPIDLSQWNIVDIGTFDEIEMIWRHYRDERYRVTLPGVMTDHAIRTAREENPERMIVHYMQPHLPYIGRAIAENRSPTDLEMEGYERLETGDASREEVYGLYKETLRFVLDSVEVLLENIDAQNVVITADHGEAFGEFGAYGHPEGFPHPVVKRVPWVRTSATDTKSREPEIETNRTDEVDVEEHLRDLGYK
jgi:hypothetical protein